MQHCKQLLKLSSIFVCEQCGKNTCVFVCFCHCAFLLLATILFYACSCLAQTTNMQYRNNFISIWFPCRFFICMENHFLERFTVNQWLPTSMFITYPPGYSRYWHTNLRLKSTLTCVFSRYDISSNSPSGGMNEIVRSFSNLDNRTHWWNLTSSSSTDLLFPPAEWRK